MFYTGCFDLEDFYMWKVLTSSISPFTRLCLRKFPNSEVLTSNFLFVAGFGFDTFSIWDVFTLKISACGGVGLEHFST